MASGNFQDHLTNTRLHSLFTKMETEFPLKQYNQTMSVALKWGNKRQRNLGRGKASHLGLRGFFAPLLTASQPATW